MTVARWHVSFILALDSVRLPSTRPSQTGTRCSGNLRGFLNLTHTSNVESILFQHLCLKSFPIPRSRLFLFASRTYVFLGVLSPPNVHKMGNWRQDSEELSYNRRTPSLFIVVVFYISLSCIIDLLHFREHHHHVLTPQDFHDPCTRSKRQ
jgi:hypothetical protein